MRLLPIMIAALMICACSPKNEAIEQATAPVEPAPPPFTKSEWRTAFKSSFEEKSAKSTDDGITEYSACFHKDEKGKCDLVLLGKRDAFRKIDHLTPFYTMMNDIGDLFSHVGTYIAAIECDTPSVLINPTINSRNGWLFMEKVAFMADGEVVVERSFEHNAVKRDNENSWIHEKATFIASPSELAAFQRFTEAKSQIIRITGQKGYLTLPKDKTANFVKDVSSTIKVRDILAKTLKDAGGPVCNQS